MVSFIQTLLPEIPITTAVDQAFTEASIKGFHLGAYSTPLNLFNFLHRHNKQVVVIDDCAGLFSDQSSMAILKAATWPQGGRRILKWGSTSSRAAIEEFEFRGKLIIICNSFPNSADAEAVKSRSFPIRIDVKVEEAKRLLMAAAKDKIWFNDPKLGASVAKFLISRLSENSLSQVSYRTLQMGYELAKHNPPGKIFLAEWFQARKKTRKLLCDGLLKKDLKLKIKYYTLNRSPGSRGALFLNIARCLKTPNDKRKGLLFSLSLPTPSPGFYLSISKKMAQDNGLDMAYAHKDHP